MTLRNLINISDCQIKVWSPFAKLFLDANLPCFIDRMENDIKMISIGHDEKLGERETFLKVTLSENKDYFPKIKNFLKTL